MNTSETNDEWTRRIVQSLPVKPYYAEGGIVIVNSDCRDILPHLPKVDLVLTDPPYGIGFAAQPTKWQRLAGHQPIGWDDLIVEGIVDVIAMAPRSIVWGGNYYSLPVSKSWLCWFKPDAPPSMGQFELAWTNCEINTRMISRSISATNHERIGHPTQKPLSVMSWCLSFAPDAQTILDPFMGSGTTLRAAKDLGRKCIGIEIEEKYCEIAVKRLRQEVLQF